MLLKKWLDFYTFLRFYLRLRCLARHSVGLFIIFIFIIQFANFSPILTIFFSHHKLMLEVHMTKDITIHYGEGDKCGFNRIYTYCGSFCNATCSTYNLCEPECFRGCMCAPNYAESMLVGGVCVPVLSPLCKFDRIWKR